MRWPLLIALGVAACQAGPAPVEPPATPEQPPPGALPPPPVEPPPIQPPPPPVEPPTAATPAVVLVSIDGFRWDYLDRGITPELARIAERGVRADALRPAFPTKTFPNHYSIVTGLLPGHHGIVGNRFRAPDVGRFFSMSNRESQRDPRFWLGTPIWVVAEREGLRTAPYFWPGSEADIGGIRPTWWVPYDQATPDTARIRQVLDWLALPLDQGPAFVTLYFSLVDAAGHDYGPVAPETDRAIAEADRLVGLLDAGLEQLGRPVNLMLVSDHGMAATSPDQVVWLDDLVRGTWLDADETSPVLMAWPRAGMEDSLLTGLRRSPHLTVYRRSELPARWELAESPRVAPVVAVAEKGWSIAWRPGPGQPPWSLRGAHGYDDTLPSMGGLFLARGPAFCEGVRVPAFRNVHLYPLLAHLLGVTAPASDGSLDSVRAFLSAPASSALPPPPGSARAAPPRARSSSSPAPR